MKALTAISIAIGILTSSLAHAATSPSQFHAEKDARIVDLGLAPQSEVRSISLSLVVNNLAAMEAYAASASDPASPNYRKFLTPAQVGDQFGQDATSVAQVVNFLQAQGLTVTKVYTNRLLITAQGTNAQLAAVFGSPIHTFKAFGETYEAPASTTAIPTQLAGLVKGVHGLDARPMLRSNVLRQPMSGAEISGAKLTPGTAAAPNANAQAAPGQYTTVDLAARYNITPLYQAGIIGTGKTMGIITLAGYNQSDAYTYWNTLGIPAKAGRITDVLVDGGPRRQDGPGSPGSGETTLDVQQSGGVAPGANMRVYLAPNSNVSFINAIAKAVDENIVDTLSISWGSPEIATGALEGMHTQFLAAAVQGIPVIAAAGDSGAYDINRNYPYPDCTTLLSVDHPAADPLVLAAGGTTLPISLASGAIKVTTERAWAWDYVRDFIVKNYGQTAYYSDYFAVGGGGGVSVNFARPTYQNSLTGVLNSASAQSLLCKASLVGGSGSSYVDLIDMPSNYAGRNLPDISLNADPFTGYLVYQGGWSQGSGGTSFVSPQLNGIFTLIAAGANSRLGLPHPVLYGTFKTKGYGAGSPFRPITSGTDFYYSSKASFNPATGLGTLDVANLARVYGVAL